MLKCTYVISYSVSRSSDAKTTKNLAYIRTVKILLILPIRTTMNHKLLFSYFVCGVLAPGQMVRCPKEAVAYHLPKYLLLYSPVQCALVLEGSCG